MRRFWYMILCVFIIGLCLYFSGMAYKEKVYFIPGKKLFLRIKYSPLRNYGYIFFGKDSASFFLPSDYLRLPRIIDFYIVDIYINVNNDSIYFSPADKVLEMKHSYFTFVEKEQSDSTLFIFNNIPPLYKRRKPEYMAIKISDFMSDIIISQDSTTNGKILKPIYISK